MTRNTLLMLIDGATDHHSESIGGTPLSVAHKPNIDAVASSGTYGCTDGRPYTHRFLLELLTGRVSNASRGPVEALGAGMTVDGRVAYRLSPARVEDGRVEWVYRVDTLGSGRMASSVRRWGHLIADGFECAMYSGGRGIVTVPGDEVHEGPMPPVNGVEVIDMGPFTEFCERVAGENDGITAMPWGGGTSIASSPIARVNGLSVLSKSPSALGVGAALGLRNECIMSMEERFDRASELLDEGDVMLHIEETDDVSHRRMPMEKVREIERVDRLLGEMGDGFDVMLLVDHGASSVTGEHIAHRVPFAHSSLRDGEGSCFCESAEGHVPLVSLMERTLR